VERLRLTTDQAHLAAADDSDPPASHTSKLSIIP
jgi:hypothetical protein